MKKRTHYRDAVEFIMNGDINLSGDGNPFHVDLQIEKTLAKSTKNTKVTLKKNEHGRV